MKIIDNFLEQSYFDKINQVITTAEIPWYVTTDISIKGETFDNLFYQTHSFFDNHTICSPYFEVMREMLEKLEVKALIRMRANMYPGREKLSSHGWHIDCPFDNKTALFYINSNDGYTEFKDGTKISSVKNRLVIFNSKEEHRSTDCTNDYARFNININYF